MVKCDNSSIFLRNSNNWFEFDALEGTTVKASEVINFIYI